MSTSFAPVMTFNAAGNVIASGSLAGGASTNANVDVSAKFAGIVTVTNTPGGSVSSTRGVQIQIFNRYGSTPTTAPTAMITITLPSASASTAESAPPIALPPGKYNVTLTNLDASNAVTVAATMDTIDSVTG